MSSVLLSCPGLQQTTYYGFSSLPCFCSRAAKGIPVEHPAFLLLVNPLNRPSSSSPFLSISPPMLETFFFTQNSHGHTWQDPSRIPYQVAHSHQTCKLNTRTKEHIKKIIHHGQVASSQRCRDTSIYINQ